MTWSVRNSFRVMCWRDEVALKVSVCATSAYRMRTGYSARLVGLTWLPLFTHRLISKRWWKINPLFYCYTTWNNSWHFGYVQWGTSRGPSREDCCFAWALHWSLSSGPFGSREIWVFEKQENCFVLEAGWSKGGLCGAWLVEVLPGLTYQTLGIWLWLGKE